MQQPQVGQKVDDLLLVVVVATGRAEGREPELAERLLVELRVGAGREQEDDLARGRLAGIDEILDARCHMLGLCGTPVRARVLVGRLVGDKQLDRRAEGRIGEAAGGRERLERVAEVGREEVVDDVEHLRARAVVLRQRKDAARGLAPLAKDVDVGVPEAVDRLKLVPHEEDFNWRCRGALGFLGRRWRCGAGGNSAQMHGPGEHRAVSGARWRRSRASPGGSRHRPGTREQIYQLALKAVRVLELVDEHRAEAPALALADRRVVPKEVPRVQLEILEVERRLALLRGRVGVGKASQQLLEEPSVSCGQLVERRLLDAVARLFVAREPVTRATPGGQVGEVDQPLGRGRALQEVERPRRALPRRLSLLHPGRVLEHAPRLLAQLLDPRLERRPGCDLEDEVPARRAQRLVDPGQHPPQPAHAVRGKQADPLGILGCAEGVERLLERLAGQHSRLVLVEHAEVRVDAGLEGVRLQQAVTEPVDRRDPGAVQLAREIVAPELREPPADSPAQLAGSPLGVRDRKHRVDGQAAVADRPDEALDEHGRLARARACRDEDEPARVDGGQLLFVRRLRHLDHGHDLATRHIDHRSHHVGQGNPPFGSCRTSPDRMRSTKRSACSFARSVWPQNSSSSR